LTKCLTDADAVIRGNAASALGSMGAESAVAVKALTKCLADGNAVVRRNATSALSRVGPDAEPAVTELTELLTQPKDKELIASTAEALAGIGPAGIPGLKKALRTSDKKIVVSAAYALASMGAEAQSAIQELIDFVDPSSPLHDSLDDPRHDVFQAALTALAGIGNNAAQALWRCLQRNDNRGSWADDSVEAIGKMGRPAIPVLLECAAREKDSALREAAVRGLGEYAASDRSAFQGLLKALSDKSSSSRARAVWCLGRIRVSDKTVVDALTRASSDENDFVRREARQALQKIGCAPAPQTR